MGAKRAQKAAEKPQSRTAAVQRDAKGRIAGGGSLNPGGLPKWRKELTEALKDSAQSAANLLERVIDDEGADMQHRIQAAAVALRYTVPTPKQQVEVSGSVSALQQIDAETLRRIASGG